MAGTSKAARAICLWLTVCCTPPAAWAQLDGRSSPVGQSAARSNNHAGNAGDIIVTATPSGPFAVTVDTPDLFADRAEISRQAASNAQFFSRCIKNKDASDLRDLIDGAPNGSVRIAALDHIVRNHMACYPNIDVMGLGRTGIYGDCNPRGEVELQFSPKGQVLSADTKRYVCQSFYDRGAIVDRVLSVYAPDLQFTTDQLFKPETRARLHVREDRFDKTRPAPEQIYAKIVTCIVGFHPDLSLAYRKTVIGSTAEAKLRGAMIGMSPQCVAGAKQVSVDPSQFRIYVTDAIYSWALALKGGESLIPAS